MPQLILAFRKFILEDHRIQFFARRHLLLIFWREILINVTFIRQFVQFSIEIFFVANLIRQSVNWQNLEATIII